MVSAPYLSSHDKRFFGGLIVIGALVLACGSVFMFDRIWRNLLVIAFYLLTIGLGGAVFLATTRVAGAGWHVAFRRVPEAMARILPITGLLMLLVAALKFSAYGWHHHGEAGAGSFWFKELWLTPAFWMGRSVAYVVVWILLSGQLVNRSLRQDDSGEERPALNGGSRMSAFFLLVFALTFTLACFDWIMALEPMWFSTIFGVYHFAGMFQAALAVAVILALLLRAPGRALEGVFRDDHLHDLGKLMLGLSCFWMYIWFSQYMLVWYSNIPEETSYFMLRMQGAWSPVVVLLIVLNWVIPFFVLLPRPSKRSSGVMLKVAVVVLVGRWVDLYLMVFPATLANGNFSSGNEVNSPTFGIWEVAALSCLVGLTPLLLFRSFSSINPVPQRDPFLAESLHYDAR